VLTASGCRPSTPFYFLEDGDLSHYKGVATDIEYPDVQSPLLAEVEGALPPMTVRRPEAHEIWNLPLEEAVQITLANSKILRTLSSGPPATATRNLVRAAQTFQLSGRSLLQAPQTFQSVYDPAIVESNPRTGVEGALSAFDAQFAASTFWERNHRPVNFRTANPIFASVLEQDLGRMTAEVRKTTATGGTYYLRNNTTYEYNNNPLNLFPSVWNTNVEAEFRHPLLQGAGVAFNRIAGPNAQPGFFFGNGVAVARVNVDIALTDFEGAVRNIVSETEVLYWRLYGQYRQLDAQVAARNSSLQTWRRVHALFVTGAEGGRAEEEAQAREQYFSFRASVEQTLTSLYSVESQLRFVMGLAPTDGRLIRPSDEPTTAKVELDWTELMTEGLARNVDLRRQKWVISRDEMILTASRNFLLPRLDAVGRYRWLGFGDHLIDYNNFNNAPFDNAVQSLTNGEYQEWQLGGQLTIPIGYRQPLAGVRNAQLQLAKDRAMLNDQELELAHLLQDAMRQKDLNYTLSQTQFNRRIAAQAQVKAVQAAYDVGQVTLDLVLDAQRRLADAETEYYLALVDYNLAIVNVHYHKGSLLEYNGVYLAEGPWPAKAYFDARKRARERDAGIYLNYGITRPSVFSQGPYQQFQNRPWFSDGTDADQAIDTEVVPTPDPVPQQQPQGDVLPSQPEPSARSAPVGQATRAVAAAPATSQPFHWGPVGLANATLRRDAPTAPGQQVNYQQVMVSPGNEANQNQPTRRDHRTAPNGPRTEYQNASPALRR